MTTATEKAAYRRRIENIVSWLLGPADGFGECDQCHDNRALWDDLQAVERGDDGGWQYCRDCWEKRLASARRRMAELNAAT